MSCAVHVVDTQKEKYTSLYIKWNDLNNENKELKEEMEALKKELADARKLHSSQIDILDENKKLKEEVKELKEEDGENGKFILFLKAECCAGGWAGMDNDPHEFANDVKQYFKEYKKHDNIEDPEELYKEWVEWSCIEDQLNPCEY